MSDRFRQADLAHEPDFLLGSLHVRPSRLELAAGASSERLEPQVMQVLIALAAAEGGVLSRGDLLERCWNGRIVGEDSIQRCIAKLRSVLERLGGSAVRLETVPRVGYRLAVAGRRAGVAPREAGAGGPAVAVLPFRNLNAEGVRDYFSDGLSEDLVVALGRWRSFPVIARGASLACTADADPRECARRLGARFLLEGSVRRDAARVRVTVRLVDGRTARQLWAERYDRDLGDLFAVQDDITRNIVAVVGAELNAAAVAEPGPTHGVDPIARDLHLRGRALLDHVSPAANARARDLLETAAALDPDAAGVLIDLSSAYSRDLLFDRAADRELWLQRAWQAARRAVELDPASAPAHDALSTVYLWRGENALAVAEEETAVSLNPYDPVALHGLGNKSDLAGDVRGVRRMAEAQRLCAGRLPPHWAAFLARAQVNAGDPAAAVDTAQRAVRRRPDYPGAWYILALALGQLRRGAESRAALERCDVLEPGFVRGREAWTPYVDLESNRRLAEGLRHARVAP